MACRRRFGRSTPAPVARQAGQAKRVPVTRSHMCILGSWWKGTAVRLVRLTCLGKSLKTSYRIPDSFHFSRSSKLQEKNASETLSLWKLRMTDIITAIKYYLHITVTFEGGVKTSLLLLFANGASYIPSYKRTLTHAPTQSCNNSCAHALHI